MRENKQAAVPFDARERELIRGEFAVHFRQPSSLANEILLRAWHGGPARGEPKLPAAVLRAPFKTPCTLICFDS